MNLRLTVPTSLLRLSAPVLVSLGLTLAILFQAQMVAPIHRHTSYTFQGLEGVEQWPDLYRAWAPRVLSVEMAETFVELSEGLPQISSRIRQVKEDVPRGIAFYVAFWFALICGVWLITFRERSIFYILGTYACLSFGYMPGIDYRIMPWDMPAVFFYTVLVALLVSRAMRGWMIAAVVLLIWLAVPFKETAVVFAIFPLFLLRSQPLSHRLGWTALAGGGAVVIKLVLNLVYNSSVEGMTTQSFFHDGPLLEWNLRMLAHGHVFLVNAGTLLAFLLLPVRNEKLLMFKVMAVSFILGQFLFGVVSEYRIWLEMIPVALYGLDVVLLSDRTPEVPAGTSTA
jgi:hypothetical protein